MLILFETPAGFALFKISQEGKFKNVDDISNYFESESKAKKL